MEKPNLIPEFSYWCDIHGYCTLIKTSYGPDSAAEDAMEEYSDAGNLEDDEIHVVDIEDWKGNKFVVEVYVDWSPSFTGYLKK